MLSDIKIYRTLSVINGFVQIPPSQDSDKTRVTVAQADSILGNASIPGWGAVGDWGLHRLTMGSGNDTGSHFGCQQFFVLPPVTAGTWYIAATEPIRILNAALPA